jgi:hypothetical protein
MNLENLINFLENENQEKIVKLGIHNPQSYRGDYEQLAFEPIANISCKEMLKEARSALGRIFCGWKGGEFQMHEETTVNIAKRGECGEEIGEILLNYMFEKY